MTFPATPIAHAIAGGTNSATTSAIDSSTANLLPVFVGWYAGITADVTVSDSKFNTWLPLTKTTSADGAFAGRIWYPAGTPTVGSGHTFASNGTSTYSCIAVQAWAGAHATPFDVENGAATTSGAGISTGAITPNQAGSLIVSGYVTTTLGTYTVDSGMTLSDALPLAGGVYEGGADSYFVQGSAASFNPAWANSAASGYQLGVIAAFKPSAGGGGGGLLPFNQPPLIAGFRPSMGGNFQG